MIRKAIQEGLKKKGIKQSELAKHLEINRSSLNAFLRGKRPMTLVNIEKSFLFLELEIVLKNS